LYIVEEGTNRFHIVDLWRGRLERPELLKMLIQLERKWKPDITLVEGIGAGLNIFQQLRATLGNRIFKAEPKDDKVVRAERQTAFIDMYHIRVPVDAPWLDDFRKEIVAFPGGRFDDQVDTMVQVSEYADGLMLWADRISRRHDPASEGEPPRGKINLNVYSLGEPRRLVDYSTRRY
jgi:predicted phage terminase large subunit-like protein